jgi:AcrR family transcriptional regulator
MAKKTIENDPSTEEKIKAAARKVFTQKGFAATRTRDIAEEAGINLALLNYYFRSKEKLFDIVMMEKVHKLFGLLGPALNDTGTTLEQKLEQVAGHYIDMLNENPDLPIFVLSEIRNSPERFGALVQPHRLINDSEFSHQLQQLRPDIHPAQFILTFMGMMLFPFIARPVINATGSLDQGAFRMLMEQRKQLIPMWMNTILTVND